MSMPHRRTTRPQHATRWVAAVTLIGGLLVLTGTLPEWAEPVVFLIQAATAVAAVWVITMHQGGSTYERKIVVPSVLLIVVGVAAAGWSLATGNAWPVILAGAAQLGWATGPAPRHNPD
jgi:hypothetical protein